MLVPFVAWMGMPGWVEISVVIVVGLLLFGRRLPDLARSAGSSIVEFRRALSGHQSAGPSQDSTDSDRRA